MGLEPSLSKGLTSRYVSGRRWVKVKNLIISDRKTGANGSD